MDKMKMQTANKANENYEKLAALFPNAVTEAIDENGEVVRAIDKDVLMQEIACKVVEGNEERYQFTWPDKKQAVLTANAPINKTLRPCREESVDFDSTENLYIEGDNLEVLKLLQETYLGKIKMIYIDPPYNTGNDFVYEDDFAESADDYIARSGQLDEKGNRLVQNTESNGRFHTDWLNMIYPRLKLARDLLTEDGVILINMDENEITNLQRVCQELFGEKNDLGIIIWDKRNPKGDAQGISSQHEYILVYAKNKGLFTAQCKIQRPKKNAKAIIAKANQLFAKVGNGYTLDDANRDLQFWITQQTDLSGGERAYNRIDESGKVYQAVSMSWPNKKKAPDDYWIPLIHPRTGKPCPVPEKGWRNPSSTMKELFSKGLILFGADETTQPRRKYLLEENMSENIPSLLYYGGSDTSLLSGMGIPFETPKVVSICEEHIASFSNRDDIILDFFSGSSTTAHAVMQLNAEDGGHRKFIMVQLPEETDEKSEAFKAGYKNICEIGKERIRRAGAKIKAELERQKEESAQMTLEDAAASDTSAANLDVGFRVLKCDSSNMKDVYYNPAEYEPSLFSSLADNIKEDRTPEDLLFQVMLDLGILLSSKIEEMTIGGKKVFNVADGFLYACFDQDITDDVITEIAQKQPYYFVMRDSSMANDSVATNFEPIFKTYSPDTVRKVL